MGFLGGVRTYGAAVIGRAVERNRLRPVEQSLGDMGWQYAGGPLPSASGVNEEARKRLLCGKPFVAMMQAADLWKGHDLAGIRRMN